MAATKTRTLRPRATPETLPVHRRASIAHLPLLTLLAAVLGCPSNGSSDSGTGVVAPAVDLADVAAVAGELVRIHGSVGLGSFGVPVAGGHDVDGNGEMDIAFSAMLASPGGLNRAGEIYLVFGDGQRTGTLDTAVDDARILHIVGTAAFENSGSEIWMDDVTGDGVGDLLIARQNFQPDVMRVGAGALSIIRGGSELESFAATFGAVDLAAPPPGIVVTTILGAERLGRLGIWVRTGDVTGDGIADVLIGADQEDSGGEVDSGAAYLIRGGAHLATGLDVDLANFGATGIVGHLARITPPPGSTEFHFGATCQIGDLDGNGRGEVLVAATLNRAGASLAAGAALAADAHSTGGAPDGRLFIAWDDNFLDNPWDPGFEFSINMSPGSTSTISGGARNVSFGEEILAGLDYDDDGFADLFVGDIVGDATTNQSRPFSGSGHILYRAESLRGTPPFDLDHPPAGLQQTTFIGPAAGDIASDTALQGDFDGDGLPDLAFSSPHGRPVGRSEAGIIHIAHGQSGPFPERVDLRAGNQPDPATIRLSEIHGVKTGDVLCYSAASGDYDGDGIDDLIVNEMLGDGIAPGTNNVGNLIVVSGTLIESLP